MSLSEIIYNFADMIELERHIENLLLNNDCVVVPGLGGFVAHHVSARYDQRDNMFLPPLRTIGFNPQLTLNDSLLAQSYVETYDMSFPQAMRSIESQVSQLKEQLSDKGVYEMHGIGRLFINNEGKIGFDPIEAGILTPTFYGLGGFEMKPLALHDNQDADSKARIIALTTDTTTGQKMVSVSVKALRNVAVAAMFIAALFFIASPINNNPRVLSSGKMKSGILFDIFSHDNNDKSTTLPTYDATTAATQETANKKAEQANTSAEQWVIVLCSHVGEKNAKNFVEELAKEKIAARIINAEKAGNAKVVYGTYPTKEKAQEALSAMRSNKHFAEAWLLQTK